MTQFRTLEEAVTIRLRKRETRCFRFDLSKQLQITANKMQLLLNLLIFADAIHVSGGSSAHHQEHITVRTASGIVN
jgi:hypothetical protein